MSKKEMITKGLLFSGCLLAVVNIFCLFGEAVFIKETYEGLSIRVGLGNMFQAIFATGQFKGMGVKGGLITLFVFEILSILIAGFIVFASFSDKIPSKYVTYSAIGLSVLLLVCAILGFCTKAIVLKDAPNEVKGYYHLGVGAVLYSVFSLLGMGCLISSIAYNKLAK